MKHRCDLCNFSTPKMRDFKKHSRVHRHRCHLCSEVLTTKVLLSQHIVSRHTVTQGTQTDPVERVAEQRPHIRVRLGEEPRHRHLKERYRPTVRSNMERRQPQPGPRRPRWKPARVHEPTPIRSVESKAVCHRATTPVPSDTDPLGLLDSPIKIDF
jgi:hypothetical protein